MPKIDGDIWGNGGESEARRGNVFRWLTRTGMGRNFPGTPIGWYQQHQVCAIDAIQAAAKAKTGSPDGDFSVVAGEVVVRAGRKRVKLGSTHEFFRKADVCARR